MGMAAAAEKKRKVTNLRNAARRDRRRLSSVLAKPVSMTPEHFEKRLNTAEAHEITKLRIEFEELKKGYTRKLHHILYFLRRERERAPLSHVRVVPVSE